MKNDFQKEGELNWPWWLAISFTVLASIVLRFLWPEDMDYYADHRSAFFYSQAPFWDPAKSWIENGLGTLSSVGLLSPGFTNWAFQILAKTFGIHTPMGLSMGVRFVNVVAMGLLLFFALKIVSKPERKLWLWAWMLMAVNPFALMFQRRMWPPVFLYFFMALMLIGFWRRDKAWGSFLWGVAGCLMGQLHMLAGLISSSFLLWAFVNRRERVWVRLPYWLAGMFLAGLPAIPWVIYFVQESAKGKGGGAHTLDLLLQFRFWRYWVTQPAGLLLTYFLEPGGYFREFLRFPLLAGKATYLVGLIHAAIAGILALILGNQFLRLGTAVWRRAKDLLWIAFWGKRSDTDAAVQAGFWGFGLGMMTKTFYVYRHYLIGSAPLEFAWLVRAAMDLPKKLGPIALSCLFVLELALSLAFLGYIHVNDGAPGAEYGHTYRAQREMGMWTSNNNPLFHRDVYHLPRRKNPVPLEEMQTDYR